MGIVSWSTRSEVEGLSACFLSSFPLWSLTFCSLFPPSTNWESSGIYLQEETFHKNIATRWNYVDEKCYIGLSVPKILPPPNKISELKQWQHEFMTSSNRRWNTCIKTLAQMFEVFFQTLLCSRVQSELLLCACLAVTIFIWMTLLNAA